MCKPAGMIKTSVIDAARNFLSTVWGGIPPSDAALAAALDRLFVAYHDIQPLEVTYSELAPPEQEWNSLYNEVAKRFPDYGLYPILNPLEVYEPTLMMADSIDDIADITKDMRDTIWLGKHVGLDQAHSSYVQFYFHWGQHARELSLYLHARQFR